MLAIIGSVKSAVHSVEKPREAPATAYVPMPDGSSSDAPVMRPGPRILSKRLTGFGSLPTDASVVWVPEADSECGIRRARLSAPLRRRRVEAGIQRARTSVGPNVITFV
jgi:hypothetical protein